MGASHSEALEGHSHAHVLLLNLELHHYKVNHPLQVTTLQTIFVTSDSLPVCLNTQSTV